MTQATDTNDRNWLSYLMDSLVHSGTMPSWEATEYLTSNLIGEAPNTQLHESKSPYEAIHQFLHRVYGPIVEAASRSMYLPKESMIHMFTDISVIGNSAVLVVYFPGGNKPHQLLLLDGVKAWDLMFQDTNAFNAWAKERHAWITDALKAVSIDSMFQEPTEASMVLSS
jgi:hypothetical protein